MKNSENGSVGGWLLIILLVLIVAVIGIGFFYSIEHAKHANPSSNGATVDIMIKTTDLAPGVAANLKTKVLVKHADSSEEVFLVPNGMVSGYIKSLPEGDSVISQTPPNQ